jgi:hypothetical protein
MEGLLKEGSELIKENRSLMSSTRDSSPPHNTSNITRWPAMAAAARMPDSSATNHNTRCCRPRSMRRERGQDPHGHCRELDQHRG